VFDCLAADKVTYDHILLNKSVPVGTFPVWSELELKRLVPVHVTCEDGVPNGRGSVARDPPHIYTIM
jgi:hypothetical protein